VLGCQYCSMQSHVENSMFDFIFSFSCCNYIVLNADICLVRLRGLQSEEFVSRLRFLRFEPRTI
jgi:hypothetical protein